MAGSILELAWRRYLQQLEKRPLKTKVRQWPPGRTRPPSISSKHLVSPSASCRLQTLAMLLTVAHELAHLLARPLCSLSTQAITAGVLAGVSDLLAQRLSGTSSSGTNWRRTLAIALYGVVWSGPAGHYWQQVLERLFPDRKDPLRRLVWLPVGSPGMPQCSIAA